jgi:hypothetical protein
MSSKVSQEVYVPSEFPTEISYAFFISTMQSPHVRWVPYHHGMARPHVADERDGLQVCGVAANILNKQSRTADKLLSSSLGVGDRPKNSSFDKLPKRKKNGYEIWYLEC